jgi:hypothetical protein
MSKIIAASIDLTKLDKSRIKPGKNGAEYYDISIILNDQPNQYGQDTSITTGQTKEERAAKNIKVLKAIVFSRPVNEYIFNKLLIIIIITQLPKYF